MLVKSVIWSGIAVAKPIGDRLYELYEPISAQINTDEGRIAISVQAGFKFDGRSGGKVIDLFGFPNLGSQNETKAWLMHDLLYHDICFSRKEADDLLRFMLRKYCGWGAVKTGFVYRSVRAFGYWAFGEPNYNDPISGGNMKLLTVRHYDK